MLSVVFIVSGSGHHGDDHVLQPQGAETDPDLSHEGDDNSGDCPQRLTVLAVTLSSEVTLNIETLTRDKDLGQ